MNIAPAFATAALAMATLALLRHYLGLERAFHPWDASYYYDRAVLGHEALTRLDLSAWFKTLREAPSDLFYTPHHLFYAAFGLSRDSYVAACGSIFFPLTGLAAVLCLKRRFPGWSWQDSLFTLALSCGLAVCWKTTLEGLPDSGGLIFIPLVFLAYDRARAARSLKRMLLFGLLAGCLIAFRRSYSYVALCLLVACGLDWIVWSAQSGRWSEPSAKNRGKALAHDAFLWAAAALAACAAVIFLAPDTWKMLFRNPVGNELAGWKSPVGVLLAGWGKDFGLAVLLLMPILYLLYVAFARRKSEGPGATLNVFFLAVLLWVLIWAGQVRHSSTHHSVIMLPMAFIMLAAAGTQGLPRAARSAARLALLALAWGGTLAMLFPAVGRQIPETARPWLPHSFYPQEAAHYDFMLELAADINRLASEGENRNVLFAASSSGFNYTVLNQAAALAAPVSGTRLAALPIPDVDSAAIPPLAQVAESRFILLALPTQYHMAPEQQRSMAFMAEELLAPGGALEKSFTLVRVYRPDRYVAAKSGVNELRLFERTAAPTPEESLALRQAYAAAVNAPSVRANGRWLIYGNGVKIKGAMHVRQPAGPSALLFDFEASAPLQGELEARPGIKAAYSPVAFSKTGGLVRLATPANLAPGVNTLPALSPQDGPDWVYGLEFIFAAPLGPRSPGAINFLPTAAARGADK